MKLRDRLFFSVGNFTHTMIASSATVERVDDFICPLNNNYAAVVDHFSNQVGKLFFILKRQASICTHSVWLAFASNG
jgi:hypothetical protein